MKCHLTWRRLGSWRRRALRLMAGVFVMLPAHDSWGWQDGGRALHEKALSAMPAHRRYPNGFKPASSGANVLLEVAKCIQDHEWSVYLDMLHASDAQRGAAAALYEQYRIDDWAHRDKHLQPLFDQAAGLAADPQWFADKDSIAVFEALIEAAQAASVRLLEIESAFLDSIQAVIAQAQWPSLETVRSLRHRVRCRENPSGFHNPPMELEVLLVELRREGFDVSPREPDAFASIMGEYATAIDQLHGERARLDRQKKFDWMRLVATAVEAGRMEDGAAEKQRLLEQSRAMREAPTRLARSIRERTGEFVARLKDQLPPATAQALEDRFRVIAYPPVFPNAFEMREVFAAAESCDLSDDARKELEEILAAYRVECDGLDRQLMKRYLDWKHRVSILSGYQFVEHEAYSDEMLRLQGLRRELGQRMTDALGAAIELGACEAVGEAMTRRQREIEQFDAHVKGLADQRQRWPEPYQ